MLRSSAPELRRSSTPENRAPEQRSVSPVARSSSSELLRSPSEQRSSAAPDSYRSVVQARPLAAPPSAPELDSSPDPTAELGDRSEPETYDRLVDAFLNTESESIRRRIATRLHSSRNSDHPLARFYANRAIERLVDAGAEEALETVMSTIGVQ